MIKFLLTVNDKKIRDIESLRENFCIDDVLDVYNNGLLEKWLKVRDYSEEYEKLKNIDKDISSEDLIENLIDIFKIECTDEKLKDAVTYYKEIQERETLLKYYNDNKEILNKILSEYKAGKLTNSEELKNISENIKVDAPEKNEKTEEDLEDGMKIVIPKGEPVTVQEEDWEHGKIIMKPYSIGIKPVTWKLWKEVYDWAIQNGYSFDNKEIACNILGFVVKVTWLDCIVWCNAYTEKTMGRKHCVYNNINTNKGNILTTWARSCGYTNIGKIQKKGYRLPTTFEWEFAALGGNPNIADWNYKYSGSNELSEVMNSKKVNVLGLYDMSGSISEFMDIPLLRSWEPEINISQYGYIHKYNSEIFINGKDSRRYDRFDEYTGFRLACSL